MDVTVHRGKNQIGGSIIEVRAGETRILLDAGRELDDDGSGPLPELPDLFEHAGFDALFLSHYHGDHAGLAYDVHRDIPIYIGEASYRMIRVSDRYRKKESFTPKGFLYDSQPIHIGEITVTPYLCDHSAFDSYMLLCESGGETILYTGDFRSNGRKSYDVLLKKLPRHVDRLICEGTTLSRENVRILTEKELEESAVELFRNTAGPVFVLQATMNIDRIVTMYRAAKRSRRVFLEDVYMADMASAAGKSIPNPAFDDVYPFLTTPARYEELAKYEKRVGKPFIARNRFVMCVRESMLSYLKSLSGMMNYEGGLLVYSLWSGYRETESMKRFLSSCEELGLRIVSLHTSGHADESALKKLIETVTPGLLIPVHTENTGRFREITSVPIEEAD